MLHPRPNYFNVIQHYYCKFSGKCFLSTNKYKNCGKIEVSKNGLTVASNQVGGDLSAVGVFIKAGSRYCHSYPAGISHMVKRLSFSLTSKYQKITDLADEINACQAATDCQAYRDILVYATVFSPDKLERALKLLGECVLRPVYNDANLEEAKRFIEYEISQEQYLPDPENEFSELRCKAAFGDHTYGLRLLADLESLSKISTSTLYNYHKNFFTPDRCVVTGINTNHDELIDAVEKAFDFSDTTWNNLKTKISYFEEKPKYTGGVALNVRSVPRAQPGHYTFPEFTNVALGFEGFPANHPNAYTAYVMHGILGGGKSFSSGGPGKGLMSRLNSDVMQRVYCVNDCVSDFMAFVDAGAFFIHGSCSPDYALKFINVIIDQYYGIIKKKISAEELQRAKNQVLSKVLLHCEQSSALLGEIGSSVSAYNKVLDLEEMVEKIDNVTVDDVESVCEFMLNTKPSLAISGMMKKDINFEDLCNAIKNRSTLKVEGKYF